MKKQSTASRIQNIMKPILGSAANIVSTSALLNMLASEIGYFANEEKAWEAPSAYMWTTVGISLAINILDSLTHYYIYQNPRYMSSPETDEKQVGTKAIEGHLQQSHVVDEEQPGQDSAVQPEKKQSDQAKSASESQDSHHEHAQKTPLLNHVPAKLPTWSVYLLANGCRVAEALTVMGLPSTFLAVLASGKSIDSMSPSSRIGNLVATTLITPVALWISEADYRVAKKHLMELESSHSDHHGHAHAHYEPHIGFGCNHHH